MSRIGQRGFDRWFPSDVIDRLSANRLRAGT